MPTVEMRKGVFRIFLCVIAHRVMTGDSRTRGKIFHSQPKAGNPEREMYYWISTCDEDDAVIVIPWRDHGI